MVGFEYTILPDGSIFKLTCPEDFREAREIAKDEAGDIYQGALLTQAWNMYEGSDA